MEDDLIIVTAEMVKTKFAGKSVMEIRDELERMGYSRHTTIELSSTEVAILTPKGILLQERTWDDGSLGLWGGALNLEELPLDGAIREVYEETGIRLTTSNLHFVEKNTHVHTYANGDKALYHSYRYVVDLDYVPQLTLDSESMGFVILDSITNVTNILSHQRQFIEKLLASEKK